MSNLNYLIIKWLERRNLLRRKRKTLNWETRLNSHTSETSLSTQESKSKDMPVASIRIAIAVVILVYFAVILIIALAS